MNWLSQMPEGEARQNAIGGLVSGWANGSPQDAANYVASLPAGKTQDSAALNVLSRGPMPTLPPPRLGGAIPGK
ncbi:MAG: hypothetical protein U1F83_19345 [Verrucomicrobiota bacterium]